LTIVILGAGTTPPAGEAAVTVTLPAKLLMLLNVTVDVAEDPALIVSVTGVAAMLKSKAAVTVTVIVVKWESVSLTPVTTTE
jgi:hypothetical protein